jgi:hypothetical protein
VKAGQCPTLWAMDDNGSALGALLELLHGADAPFTTVQAIYRTWGRGDRQAAALRAESARQKPSRTRSGIEFRRRAASSARPMFIGTPGLGENEEILRIWRAGDRVREEREGGASDGAYGVRVGDLWWYWDPRYGASSNEDHPRLGGGTLIAAELSVMLNPTPLLGELKFVAAGRAQVAARPTITAEAAPRVLDPRVYTTRHGPSFEIQQLGRGADRYVLQVDAQTGVLLEALALLDGEPFRKITTVEIAFDHPIPDERFRFQPPPSVQTHGIGELPRPQYLSPPEAQRRAPFTVLIPDRIPDEWHVHCTFFDRAERRWPPHVFLQYGTADGSDGVSLWQSPATNHPSLEQIASGTSWEQVVHDGIVVRITKLDAQTGPKALAHLERDGTFVVLASSTLTCEQLATIAARLKPAPSNTA